MSGPYRDIGGGGTGAVASVPVGMREGKRSHGQVARCGPRSTLLQTMSFIFW
jgi:hypothetical protein